LNHKADGRRKIGYNRVKLSEGVSGKMIVDEKRTKLCGGTLSAWKN